MSQTGPRPILSFRIGDQPVPGYRLVRELGRGTFGVVWLAVTDNGFERALKVVNLEQRGGKKEFRALRLIKDRKILHGNLLMLVDYWLLDREGTILNTADDPNLESQLAPSNPSKSSTSGGTGSKTKADPSAQVQVTNIALRKGTMLPVDGEDSGPMSVRDTFAQNRITDTREDESSAAIWLIVAMELGHKTLHDRQKEHTVEERGKHPSKVNRKRATHQDRKVDTSPGSNTVEDENQRRQDEEEDEELFPLPADEVLPYMEQAARGLDHLHRNEIVHRDVKPQNIMLVGDVAKVCDYGLASELNDIRATTNAFTLPYAASEAINKRPTPASDQYSLAVTYVELRTGRWPFPSNTQTAVFACKDSGVHDLKCIRKRSVRLVLKKALAKNPKDRYPTCGDFVRELTLAENSRSSIFAMAQAALAVLAIITVLMAAIATHPDVRAWIGKKADELGWIPNREAPFDLAGYINDVQSAANLLKDTERLDEANKAFESLEARRKDLPDGQQALQVDVIQGLGRSLIGLSKNDKEPSAALLESIKISINKVGKLNYTTFSDEQKLRSAYFQQIVARKSDDSILAHKPHSLPAQTSLNRWENDVWSRWTTPNTRSSELLAQLIAQRKTTTPSGLDAARELHKDLKEAAYLEKAPEDFMHEIDLEDVHLHHLAETATTDVNLKQLQDLIKKLEESNSRLKSRAYLLQLLILKKHRPEIHLFDSDVCQLVARAPQDIYTLQEAEGLAFSKKDALTIQQLRQGFEPEIVARAEPLVGGELPALEAVINLFDRSKCLTVLMDRVKARLMNRQTLTPLQLVSVTDAWTDLQEFLSRSYKDKDKELGEDEDRILADLALEAALANPQADPNQSLRDFARYFRKSSRNKQSESLEQLFHQGEEFPAWTKAALIPLRDLLNDPPVGLQSDLSQVEDWKRRLTVLVYKEILKIDPANATLLRSQLADLPRGALKDVLTVELEMAESNDHTAETLNGWQDRVKRGLDSGDWSVPDHRHLVHLLLARLQAARGVAVSESAEKNFRELLAQKERPGWFTDWRRQGAEGIFAQLAMSDFKSTGTVGPRFDDSLVYQFADIQAVEMPRLAELRSQAAMLGLNVDLLDVVDALRLATHRQNADWAKINAVLKSRNPKLDAFFDEQNCGRLLRYVAALSILNTLPQGTATPDEVVLSFDQLLHTAPNNAKPYFAYAAPPDSEDTGVLKNIVNLLVQHRSVTDAAMLSRSPEVKQALARLWGAKGRILQRSPNSVIVDDKRMTGTRDFLMAANLLAYEAFLKARDLDDQLKYAVGYGRALRYLPADMRKVNALVEMIQKYDPNGDQADPGMRYLFAYSLRLQGMREHDKAKKRDLFQQAIEKLTTLSALLDPQDTWQLAELCQESLSDAHLNLAFLSKINSAEDVRAVGEDREPTKNTQAYHLYWAAKHAQRHAALDLRYVQRPEHAAMELGNAYEDYAYYLCLTDYYPKSISEFERAIKILTNDNRDLADAQFNYGRCLYRFAVERYPPRGVPRDSGQLLQTAIDHLTEAAESKNLIVGRQAETRMWLAFCQKQLFITRVEEYKKDPASAHTLLQQANDQLGLAAQQAKVENSLRDQFEYLAKQLEALGFMRRNLTQMTVAQRQSLNDQLQKVEDDAFTLFLAQGESLGPADAGAFTKYAGFRWSPQTKTWDQPSGLIHRWLEGKRQRDIWTSGKFWLFEEFLIRLHRAKQASVKEIKDGELSRATLILPLMAKLDAEMAIKAQGHLDDQKAEEALLLFMSSSGKATTKKARLEALNEMLPSIIASAQTRAKIKTADSVAGSLRDRISKIQSKDLKGTSLNPFEQRILFDELKRFSVPDASWGVGSALMTIFEYAKSGDIKPGITTQEVGALALESLKPFYVLTDDDPYIKVLEKAKADMLQRMSNVEDYLQKNPLPPAPNN